MNTNTFLSAVESRLKTVQGSFDVAHVSGGVPVHASPLVLTNVFEVTVIPDPELIVGEAKVYADAVGSPTSNYLEVTSDELCVAQSGVTIFNELLYPIVTEPILTSPVESIHFVWTKKVAYISFEQ